MDKFGCDAYGRYQRIKGGSKIAIEPFPFRSVWWKLVARYDMARWYFSLVTGIRWEKNPESCAKCKNRERG